MAATVETRVRAMNPTLRRLYLLEHGWSKGRNDSEWRHPEHAGSHSLAAAIRVAFGRESK
jgi:hypothetical protein